MDDGALQVRVSCFKSHVSRRDLLTREGDRAGFLHTHLSI
jgi:hypothetical protein